MHVTCYDNYMAWASISWSVPGRAPSHTALSLKKDKILTPHPFIPWSPRSQRKIMPPTSSTSAIAPSAEAEPPKRHLVGRCPAPPLGPGARHRAGFHAWPRGQAMPWLLICRAPSPTACPSPAASCPPHRGVPSLLDTIAAVNLGPQTPNDFVRISCTVCYLGVRDSSEIRNWPR